MIISLISAAYWLPVGALAQPQRLALLIGNSAYSGDNFLANPVNDARYLANVLRRLDFQVIVKTNVNKLQMETAIDGFVEQLHRSRGVGLFYFSGHGIQYQGINYLIPIGAKGRLTAVWQLPHKAVKANYVLAGMKSAGNKTNLVILDACREPPRFTKGWFKGDMIPPGLTSLPAIPGSLIAYAAAPGGVASSGVGKRNSPYVEHLMAWIAKPNLSINEVLRKVGKAVRRETYGVQLPGYYDQLYEDFYFKVNAQSSKIFRDRLQEGSEGPEMVWIPAGSFRMGDVQGGGYDDEKPVHSVSVKRFAMSRYEVTFAEYDKFAEATGRAKPDDEGWGRGNRPAISVSWDDATAYAQWLSQQTGQTYRLPTEAEWEYAARAGTETKRYWGNDPDDACRYANVHDNTSKQENGFSWTHHNCTDGYAQTAPVGSFKPNAFNLFDMLGNVWEWTCSEYGDKYNCKKRKCIGLKGGLRALLGGAWLSEPRNVRAAYRDWNARDFRGDDVGFRLAR